MSKIHLIMPMGVGGQDLAVKGLICPSPLLSCRESPFSIGLHSL